jgi:hypothetical protein
MAPNKTIAPKTMAPNKTMAPKTMEKHIPLPSYHRWNDSFINHPDSFKFCFSTPEDIFMNNLDIMIDSQPYIIKSHRKKKTQMKRVRYINSKNTSECSRVIHKGPYKKKYPTKPRNRCKIEKMRIKMDIMMI